MSFSKIRESYFKLRQYTNKTHFLNIRSIYLLFTPKFLHPWMSNENFPKPGIKIVNTDLMVWHDDEYHPEMTCTYSVSRIIILQF